MVVSERYLLPIVGERYLLNLALLLASSKLIPYILQQQASRRGSGRSSVL